MSSFSTRCELCQVDRPQLFMVPNTVWQHYVGDPDKFFCLDCYRKIVEAKDGGAFERLHGKPAAVTFVATTPFVPLPLGGFAELDTMSGTAMDEFFDQARASGYWRWLSAAKPLEAKN